MTASSIAHGVTTEEAKQWALLGAVKRHSKHEFMRHPNSSHDVPSTSWDMTTVSKTGPMIAEGPTNDQGSTMKPASRVRAT
jgi:hypothetical protein